MKLSNPVKTFPLDVVLSVSFAAHRINGGYVKETNRFSEGKPPVWANKELVSYTLGHDDNLKNSKNVTRYWLPEGFVPITTIDEDIDNVEVAIKHVKRYLIGAMADKLSEFQQSVFDAMGSDSVPVTKVALLSYLPEMIKREVAESAYIRKIKSEYADSAHLVNDTFAGSILILKSHHLKDHGTNVITAGFEGNLLTFFNKDTFTVGSVIKITAKVNKRETCAVTKLPRTTLNYVKIKKS